ncbi:MAG TPA: hypothetical protein VIV12_14805 [Streptosporangiaceae bacterium]
MRPVRIIAALLFAATVGTLTLLAAPARAAPVAIHVNPSSVAAGGTVTVSGSVGPDCSGDVTLISKAFVHTHDFAGLPALFAPVQPGGAFTATTSIPRSKAAGDYTISGRCGGGTLGASATLVVRAAPATPPANVHVSPSSVAAGRTVTVSGSVGPNSAGSECASGVTLISKAFVHTYDFADLPAVGAAVKPDGTFTTTTTIPRAKPAGTYPITGRCGGATFGGATLVVRAAVTTTTPAPAAPSATAPPVTQPPVAAPAVTGPPTMAAAQPASRWIIPGLAALGSGTLAALGVWLLYRRRHPAGSSRQGRFGMAH